MDIHNFVETIQTKEDFLRFLEMLEANYKKYDDEWEPKSIGDYLKAMRAWLKEISESYKKVNAEETNEVTWKAIAEFFLAAKYYEENDK